MLGEPNSFITDLNFKTAPAVLQLAGVFYKVPKGTVTRSMNFSALNLKALKEDEEHDPNLPQPIVDPAEVSRAVSVDKHRPHIDSLPQGYWITWKGVWWKVTRSKLEQHRASAHALGRPSARVRASTVRCTYVLMLHDCMTLRYEREEAQVSVLSVHRRKRDIEACVYHEHPRESSPIILEYQKPSCRPFCP